MLSRSLLPARLVALLVLLASACAGSSPRLGVIPGALAAPPPSEPYRIQAGDELEIKFFHTPEHDLAVPVRPDGFVSLPLVHELRVAGRTVEEVRLELVDKYARELADPEIAVLVRAFTGYQVHVGGQVDSPGVLQLSGPRTVLQAVFEAGGFLPSADLTSVVVVRQTDDLGYELVRSDLEAVLEGRSVEGNFLLRSHDVVFVPPSAIANVNTWVEQYIRNNIPITFSYRLGAN